MNESFKIFLGALLRHCLSALGLWLSAKGLISKDQVVIITGWTDGLLGALLFMGTILFSWARTHWFKKQIAPPLPVIGGVSLQSAKGL